LVLLVGLFAGALFFPKTTLKYVSNVTCPACGSLISNESELSVIYLYPVDCPLCNTSRVNSLVSSSGVPFMAFMNDAVTSPQILITYVNISTIARASNDYNVVSGLCVARQEAACRLRDAMEADMKACLQKNNIPLDSVVYYYSDWCGTLCNNMNRSLTALTDEGFNVVWINEAVDSSAKECLKDFLNYAGGFPQLICPARAYDSRFVYTGALNSGQLEEFADECGK